MKLKLTNHFLLLFVLSLFCITATAQELHGYSMVIANDLSDHNFIITERSFIDDDESIYCIHIRTPEFYDESLARLTVTTVMGHYSDVKRITPWEGSYGSSESTYRINDTELEITISDLGEDYEGLPRGCRVTIYENINPKWVKKSGTSKRKSTTSKKKTSKRKR